jgi:hypothetical protein
MAPKHTFAIVQSVLSIKILGFESDNCIKNTLKKL